MSTTYIPAPDADFSAWLDNFATLIALSPTTYGLTTGNATTITAQNVAFQSAYAAAINPSTRTPATVAAKDAARATAEGVVRPFAVSISLNSGVTNDDKVAVGVTVKKTVPTPVPPPTTTPTLSLVAATHLTQQLAYRDTSTPTSKGKPPGATGIEIWSTVGPAFTTNPAMASYRGTWTKSPNQLTYGDADVGQKATIWGRWVTRGGPGGQAQVGPWSAPLQLTVM